MTKSVTIIGAGPSGLMAAQKLAESGFKVTVYERKKSPARKFLLAGRGGLNLTHSEELQAFLKKYRKAENFMLPLLQSFSPSDLRNWCLELGEETFIGSSGRVFPRTFKASPLLRSFLRKLEILGVEFKMQMEWTGWENGKLIFYHHNGSKELVSCDAVLLALGGASWPHLGSDGSWTKILNDKNIETSPLQPANCGFNVLWSDIFRQKFSGKALKTIALKFAGKTIPGEIMIDRNGIEGGAVYALSAELRNALNHHTPVTLHIDLKPGLTKEQVFTKLSQRPRNRQSLSTYLEKTLALPSLAIHLLREADENIHLSSPEELATIIKSVPVQLVSSFDIARAISSAGGVKLREIDENMMLKKIAGIFVAGEMLDWEAPTGGYLLQGCFSSAIVAAEGISRYLKRDVV